MHKKFSYNRLFIMMQEEDRGTGKGGKPTGYMKIEMKAASGKVLVHVQNVEPPRSSQILEAYLLSSGSINSKPLSVGTIDLNGTEGSVTYEFKKDEIQKEGVDVSGLDTVVVACKDTGENHQSVSYPLVGYKEAPWDWKQLFHNTSNQSDESVLLRDSRDDAEQKLKKFGESNECIEKDLESDIKQGEESEREKKIDNQSIEDIEQNNEKEDIVEESMDKENVECSITEPAIVQEDEEINKPDEIRVEEQVTEEKEAEVIQEENKSSENSVCHSESETGSIDSTEKNIGPDNDVKSKDDIKTDHIDNLFSNYKKNVEPFGQESQQFNAEYDWWVISDYKLPLNDICSRCLTTNPYQSDKISNCFSMMNNPYAISAIYRYGHYLLGLEKNKSGQSSRKYVAYAVPARYGVEPHPLLGAQAYAYWMPKKGYPCVISAPGYWMVKINMETGEFVAI